MADAVASDDTVDPSDSSALAGLFGEPADIEEIVNRLVRSETELTAREQDAFERDRLDYEARLRDATEAAARLATEEATHAAVLTEAQEILEGLRQELIDLSAARTSRVAALFARRGTYAGKYLSRKAQAYAQAKEVVAASWLDDQKRIFAWQKEMHEIEMERRRLNDPEFSRRSTFLQEQQEKAHARLRTHEVTIEKLRQAGITRTVSGFLLWSGYLSFAAIGWFLGESLRSWHQEATTPSAGLFVSLGRGVALLVANIGTWPALLLLLLLPPLFLVGIFLFLRRWDCWLNQFDSSWAAPRRSRRSDSGPFSLFGRGVSVTRSHYTDLLARLPLAYLWGLIPITVAAFPALLGSGLAPNGIDPWDSILYAYAGTVIALSATGLAMLYVTNVIRPRLENSATSASLGSRLFLNLELVAVALSCLAVFVVLPVLRTWFPNLPPPSSPAAPYGAAVLLAMISLSTASGLVFHGLFKDLSTMQVELGRYDLELQRYTALPSVDVFDEQAERFKQSLARLYHDIDVLWATPDWWSLLLGQPSLSRGERFRFVRSLLRRRGVPIDSARLYTPWDVLFEPELVAEAQRLDLDLEHARLRSDATRLRCDESLTRLDRTRDERKALLRTHDELVLRFRERTRQFHGEVERIGQLYAGLISKARSAFRVGTFLRNEPVTG